MSLKAGSAHNVMYDPLHPGDHGDYAVSRHEPVIDLKPRRKGEPASQEPFPWIDISRWDSEPIPEREWAVQDRVPLRQVTLFSGEGAVGKSIVELHLCVAHVLGRDWLGTMPVQGGAFYWSAPRRVDR